jgi:hypothetical protein
MYSMLTDLEKEYLYTFAFKEYGGQGAIVDLGCWLGSSTIALASGLREHPNPQLRSALVHAYDLFMWDGWMNDVSAVRQTPLDGKYKPGESFFEACRELTEPWKDNIRFYPGDLSSIGWAGGPIEFLFVDAMKSWHLTNSIIHDFYPSLIPGISTIVQQDFGNFYVYWVHLITYRLREYFQPVYDIPYSESLCFKYVKQIPESLLQAEYKLSSFSNDEIDAAFDYARGLAGEEKQTFIAAAELRCYLEKSNRSRVDRALFQLSDFARRTVGSLQEIEAELRPIRDDLCQARSDLNLARCRIAGMESSKFWKLRRHWFCVKRALHLPGWDRE